MSKVKMDLTTAKWIADKAQHDLGAFPVYMVECGKCGAAYIPDMGHDCKTVIELEFTEEVTEEQDE